MAITQQASRIETYLAGVRRRLKTGVIIFALAAVAGLICYGLLEASKSVPLMLLAAIVCGAVAGKIDLRVDNLPAEAAESKPERAIWLTLFAPVLIVLVAVCIFSAIYPPAGARLVGAAAVAILLGFSLAMTAHVLWARNFR